MSQDNFNVVVIRASGKTFLNEKWKRPSDILMDIFIDMSSGGSQYDHPEILVINGKIVVQKGLHNLAWEYGKMSRSLHGDVQIKLYEKAETLLCIKKQPPTETV